MTRQQIKDALYKAEIALNEIVLLEEEGEETCNPGDVDRALVHIENLLRALEKEE